METKLFRNIVGGTWYFYKIGKDTPAIMLFCKWMTLPPEEIDMEFCILLDKEEHPQRRWTNWFKQYTK